MKRLVQWGAGNIGRSFIGQVFARSGYEVVFIDIDQRLVTLLNEHRSYQIDVVSQTGRHKWTITGVSAVMGTDAQGILDAVAQADVLSVSVGKTILPRIAKQLAQAITYRDALHPTRPLDIIIAENIHGGAKFLKSLLTAHLDPSFPFDLKVGLVETSIGKMVPIQTGTDPLSMVAEPYNELIVSRDGFLNAVPEVADLKPVSPIEAYVDRKLYVHNLGHATAAYFGYRYHPDTPLLAQVLADSRVEHAARMAMRQGAALLMHLYPGVFTREDLEAHIDDLLYRFANLALGDTVYRVGRDLARKLRYDDRIMGAILAANRSGLPWDAIGRAFLAGLSFKAADESGQLFPADAALHSSLDSLDLRGKILLVSALEASGASNQEQVAIMGELQRIAAI